jgi:hypothetical protein
MLTTAPVDGSLLSHFDTAVGDTPTVRAIFLAEAAPVTVRTHLIQLSFIAPIPSRVGEQNHEHTLIVPQMGR